VTTNDAEGAMKLTRGMNPTSGVVVPVLVWLVAVLLACSGPTTVTPAPAPAGASRCVPASAAQMKRIQAGVSGRQKFYNAGTGWAVQSKDATPFWFVAANLCGAGHDTCVGPGVWAISGESDQPGLLYSVDPVAKEFSDFGDGSKTDPALDMSRDGAREAMECAARE
jgi:hypothetical protein